MRKECRGDNTAKYLQSVRAFDAISEMEPEPNLESIKEYTRFKQKEKNLLQERSSKSVTLSRNDDASSDNKRFTDGEHDINIKTKNENKINCCQKVGFEFNNENENENLNRYRHKEDMGVGARISTYAYNDDTYMERMDLVDCTDMNDSSVHTSSLLSNTPEQGREQCRERGSDRYKEENKFHQDSQFNYTHYK